MRVFCVFNFAYIICDGSLGSAPLKQNCYNVIERYCFRMHFKFCHCN